MTGSGTIGDPYIIMTFADLQSVESYADGGGVVYGYWELGADIDCSGALFVPICDGLATIFAGSFDGAGFVISNLTVSTTRYGGLFGSVLGIVGTAILKDIVLTDVSISSSGAYAGGLSGQVLSNVTVSGCSSTGSVVCGDNCYVGGLFGYVASGSTITTCLSSCDVTGGATSTVGGLVGMSESDITYSMARGDVIAGPGSYAGGFVGFLSSCSTTECCSFGDVSQSGSGAGIYIGGFVGIQSGAGSYDCFARGDVSLGIGSGYIGGFASYTSGNNIERCYASGVVGATGGGFMYDGGSLLCVASVWDTDTGGATGIVVSDGGGVTGKTTTEMQSPSTFSALGWDTATVWKCENGSYPILMTFSVQSVRTEPVSEVLVE